MSLQRYSSRTADLHGDFLAEALKGARRYLRIAGYFRSSVFEVAGEALEAVPEVKILCNSDLDAADLMAAGGEAELKARWNEEDPGMASLLRREQYRRLARMLEQGNLEIRLVPGEKMFLHGKAGCISYSPESGRPRRAFVGSVNESLNGWKRNYELLWSDDGEESAVWVEREFFALWNTAVPLPEAIRQEVFRLARREEIPLAEARRTPESMPRAALAEAPIYRGGEQLQPWQRAFVVRFLQDRRRFGKARLLLADEVGVGKTLSMAGSAVVSALLGDGPVLILSPSTLTFQWQVEMKDRLGVPSAVWSSVEKAWVSVDGRMLSPRKDLKSIGRCPCRIGIVSTGIIMHQYDAGTKKFTRESEVLLNGVYGLVILDEAHRARAQGTEQCRKKNNLLRFMERAGRRTRHMILGTATPIQTQVRELWDLLETLGGDAPHVLGDALSPWRDMERALPLVTGEAGADGMREEERWQWLCNPMPPRFEDPALDDLRDAAGEDDGCFVSRALYRDLAGAYEFRSALDACAGRDWFKFHNPVLRCTVLRKRSMLEEKGLLVRVGVRLHPQGTDADAGRKYGYHFNGLALPTQPSFDEAYAAAEEFCRLLAARTPSAGFMKSLLLKRICSSYEAGRSTAEKLLGRGSMEEDWAEGEDDEEEMRESFLSNLSPAEEACLKTVSRLLEQESVRDKKLETIRWFLTEFRTDGKNWLEHGCIIFSQYYDTAAHVAGWLAAELGDEPVALYAGVGRSRLFLGHSSAAEEREPIKRAVKSREIRVVVATDAACEGLNLQTLGTLINCDLPWNPSRMEQRLGRIKRFGQSRECVDMLNLVYRGTLDERIYSVLSERMKNIYDLFGSLPETIDDAWIDEQESLQERLDKYVHERDEARNAFTLTYDDRLDPEADQWEECSRVLSRRDIEEEMNKGW